MVCFLTMSYAAAQRKIFIDDSGVPFTWRTTIVSSVLISCISIVAAVWCDIPLMYSDLAPEYNCMETTYAWVLVLKSGVLRGSRFVFKNVSGAVSDGKIKDVLCFNQD